MKNVVWGGFFWHGQWPSCLLLNSSTEMQCKDHSVVLRLICSGSTTIIPLFRKTLAFLEISWWKFRQTRSWRAALEDSGGRGVHYPLRITSGRSFQKGKSLVAPLKWFTGRSILIPTCFFSWGRVMSGPSLAELQVHLWSCCWGLTTESFQPKVCDCSPLGSALGKVMW